MDPRLVFVVGALLMLLNGGVLGLMHRDLPREIRPSAVDWRIGTLLLAGGTLLLAAQQDLPPGFILPAGNFCLLIGLSLYWRALRRFYDRPDTPWLFLPALLGTAGVYWFAAITPRLDGRIVVVTLVWAGITVAAVWTLRKRTPSDAAVSRAVLSGIFALVGAFFALRCVYFVLRSDTGGTVTDASNWLNAVTPAVAAILPIIGTTAYLLLCSERIRRQWEHAAATDYLTGLANRRTIMSNGDARFAAARAGGASFAAAVIDIDHFKQINDRHGHDVGDAALQHVASLLDQHCRGANMVGRQGGEEFVALLDDADPAQAGIAAERLRAAVQDTPLLLEGAPLAATISIGVGVMAPGDHGFEDLLRRADQALYAAKTGGRNRVAFGPRPA